MSKLLINEHPIMVLPALAAAIGLNEAIILQQMHYWLEKSTNEREGHRWVYNSYPQWQKQFPFWGLNTIKRAIYKLEEEGLLITSNFNAHKMDKTKWYRIDYDRLQKFEGFERPSTQNGTTGVSKWDDEQPVLDRAIPETTTETTDRDNCNEVIYRERLQATALKGKRRPESVEDIEVVHPFQAKAQYIARKLDAPPKQLTSLLKACREFPESQIDIALSHAVYATVRDKTALFFKSLWEMKVEA